MLNHPKKVLLAFGTFPGKMLLKEVLTQIDPRIRLDLASSEGDLLHYLTHCISRGTPDLVILEDPPMNPAIWEMVNRIRKNEAIARVPFACFLPSANLPLMRNWMPDEGVYFFPPPGRPSECKLYVRRMLDLGGEPNTSNDLLHSQ